MYINTIDNRDVTRGMKRYNLNKIFEHLNMNFDYRWIKKDFWSIELKRGDMTTGFLVLLDRKEARSIRKFISKMN